METQDSTTRLLEMLDNPEAYSEQDIRDFIGGDETARETYRLMVATRQAYRHRQHCRRVDVDKAWQRFEQKHLVHHCQQPRRMRLKVAASFVGVLLVSSLTYATIHYVRHRQLSQPSQTEVEAGVQVDEKLDAPDTLGTEPVVFDNVPLEKMLTEIAAHYGAEVIFMNDDVRSLRFHFSWNRGQGIEKVVENLNHFERLHITQQSHQLVVE